MRLTHEQMIATVRRGEGVMHNGRVITKEAELPTPAELAQGDPAAEANTLAALQQQMTDLQAQMALLQPGGQASAEQPATPPVTPPKGGKGAKGSKAGETPATEDTPPGGEGTSTGEGTEDGTGAPNKDAK